MRSHDLSEQSSLVSCFKLDLQIKPINRQILGMRRKRSQLNPILFSGQKHLCAGRFSISLESGYFFGGVKVVIWKTGKSDARPREVAQFVAQRARISDAGKCEEWPLREQGDGRLFLAALRRKQLAVGVPGRVDRRLWARPLQRLA